MYAGSRLTSPVAWMTMARRAALGVGVDLATVAGGDGAGSPALDLGVTTSATRPANAARTSPTRAAFLIDP